MPTHRRFGAVIWVLLLVSACGAKQMALPSAAPSEPSPLALEGDDEEEAIATVSDATQRFELAEQQIAALFRTKDAVDTDDEEHPPSELPGKAKRQATKESTGGRPRDRCVTACRALGSMQRAVARLCELAGQHDPRCENARERVEGGRRTVHAACPGCRAARP